LGRDAEPGSVRSTGCDFDLFSQCLCNLIGKYLVI
jgi:hypothetical protein